MSGRDLTHYTYRLSDGLISIDIPIQNPIVLADLPNGTHVLRVLGIDSAGARQPMSAATIVAWEVNSAMPAVRLNEIFAINRGEPDLIELYNEGSVTINLAGFRLSDDPANPNRYVFGTTMLNPGAYLVLTATQLGFSFNGEGRSGRTE